MSYVAIKSVLVLFVVSLIIISSYVYIPTFAHNSSTIAIRIAKQPIILDGAINGTEWDDASKINFTSPRINEGNVIVYLKYELFSKALDGAFIIPDKTPSLNKTAPDQIGFGFDINHNASKKLDTDDQSIIFIRDRTAEYYKGDSGKLIENSKPNGSLSHLANPFSRVDLHILTNNTSWQGEFKIYFVDDPQKYGFIIQQQDSHRYNFTNYPAANLTRANIPSTWGDIDFFGVSQYAKNIRKFCSNNLSIIPNNIAILCIRSTEPPSLEEKVSGDIIIQGVLGNLINGTGINNQTLSTYIINSKGNAVSDKQNAPTLYDGSFLSTIKGVKLDSNDSYRVFSTPISGYTGLNATADLVVTRHTLTFGEFIGTLGTYFGVIAAGIALLTFVPKLKKYLSERKQKVILYRYMSAINDIYYSYSARQGKEQAAEHLKGKRNQILKSFYSGEISEEHFRLLDTKISECEQKLKG